MGKRTAVLTIKKLIVNKFDTLNNQKIWLIARQLNLIDNIDNISGNIRLTTIFAPIFATASLRIHLMIITID